MESYDSNFRVIAIMCPFEKYTVDYYTIPKFAEDTTNACIHIPHCNFAGVGSWMSEVSRIRKY